MNFNQLDYSYFDSLESSWDRLKKTQHPIFIYGMGDGCLKILSEFEKYGIKCNGIFASDDFVRGQSFQGFKICRYADVVKHHDDFVIVPAFGTSLPEIMKRLEDMSKEHTLIMPDVPVFGEECFTKEGFLQRFSQAQKIYDLLCDEQSKAVFYNVFSYKITGDIKYLKDVFTSTDEAYNILSLDSKETYVDLGAYTGDTIDEFIKRTNGEYIKIIALEPNIKNFRKCVKNTLYLDNIEWYNAAAWDKDEIRMFSKSAGRQSAISDIGAPTQCRSVDSIIGENGCTYIKFDVEGADKQAISGSVRTIRKFSPKICTALYHRAYDMLDLPLMIHKIIPLYKMYLRQYPYYPCWETNLFCI